MSTKTTTTTRPNTSPAESRRANDGAPKNYRPYSVDLDEYLDDIESYLDDADTIARFTLNPDHIVNRF